MDKLKIKNRSENYIINILLTVKLNQEVFK